MPENSPREPTSVKLLDDLLQLAASVQVRCSVLQKFEREFGVSNVDICAVRASVTTSQVHSGWCG